MKLKIRKGASVQVITGSDKGKTGTVLDIDKKAMRIRVQGVKVLTRHTKKDGIVKSEGYIDYSNVKLLESAAPKKAKKAKATKEKSA